MIEFPLLFKNSLIYNSKEIYFQDFLQSFFF